MAGNTPIYGLPYPEPTDLVADYPALGQQLAEDLDDKLPTYAATAPSSPSVGQVWIDSDDNLGRVWTGSVWQLFSGAGILAAADVSGTTGSPTITNYTSGGINYRSYEFTASGSITFSRAGLCDVLVIGGGGAGSGNNTASQTGCGGGGGGGALKIVDAYMPTGAQTVTVGAGGTGGSSNTGTSGNSSRVGPFYAVGGGNGGGNSERGNNGGSGGGAGYGQSGGSAIQGNAGGTGGSGSNFGGAGGGGGSAAGTNVTSNAGTAGGAGLIDAIKTGSNIAYSGGGGGGGKNTSGGAGGNGGGASGGSSGGSGGAGVANTGGGGGGGAADGASSGGNGGSGVVIIRVRQ